MNNPLMTPDHRATLDVGLLARFRASVASRPEDPALVGGQTWLSFADLARQTDAMATLLRPHVRPGTGVGVALGCGPALVSCALAVASLGAVYVPLGRASQRARLERLPALNAFSVFVGEPGADIPGELFGSEANVQAHRLDPTERLPEGGFYGIFTSGTTGEPNLVVSGEEQLTALVDWYVSSFGLGPGVRASLMVNPTFDAHIMEMWSSIGSGATMVAISEQDRANPESLMQQLATWNVTCTMLPTPIAEELDQLEWPEDFPVRYIQAGGDRLSAFPRTRDGVRWCNVYGPAEATVVTVACVLEDIPDPLRVGAPPIGRPIAGTEIAILDDSLRAVPDGERGELWLTGPLLSYGYAGKAALTAERFLVHDLGDGRGERRWYRTGDVASRGAEGLVYCHGRLDDQLKIRGVRVEPGEIEANLREHEGVLQVVVLGNRREASHEAMLVAFCKVAPGVREADLAAWLSGRLPTHLRPDRYVLVEAFPLTPNGKVDRRALLAKIDEPVAASAHEVTAESLWFEALPLADGNPGVGFAEAGGTSLTAINLAKRVKTSLGKRILPGLLMEENTLEGYLRQVEGAR